MKKSYIVLLVFTVLFICLASFLILKKDKPLKKADIEKRMENGKKYATNLNNVLMSNASKEELEKNIGKVPQTIEILVGDNSYLRHKLPNKISKKYDLSSYVKLQNELATNVENKIVDNFKYYIDTVNVSDVGDTIVGIRFKSYYYSLYIDDLLSVKEKIYSYLSNEKRPVEYEPTEKDKLNSYKIHVKAMQIMDSYLDNYKNDNEFIVRGITYNDGEIENSTNSIMSYLLNLAGHTYKNSKKDNNYYKNQKARVNSYMKEAIDNKTFNPKSPLEVE